VRAHARGRQLNALPPLRATEVRPPAAARRSLLVLAILLGTGLGPGVAAGAAVGGSAPPVVAAAVMIVLTVIGIAGLVISAARWTAAGRRTRSASAPAPSGPETGFATTGQRASFALAGMELLILAATAPLVLVLHLSGPQDGPGQDVSAGLVAALALVAISALIVPTIAAQVAWTCRGGAADAEAAVLARAVPGRRRLILVARAVAFTAWVLSIAGGVTTSVLLTNEATDRLAAIAASYSRMDAAEALRGDLVDEYVVGDIRCPDALPHPGRESVFTCRVTSLGRTVQVPARWFPSGFGSGGVNAADPAHAGLTRVADLPGRPRTPVVLQQDVSAAEVDGRVRAQLLAEGWRASSRAVRELDCPDLGGGPGNDAGSFRCTIGQDLETQRCVDVFPVGQHRFVARTAEIADLPR
jgi:hypothetical protein